MTPIGSGGQRLVLEWPDERKEVKWGLGRLSFLFPNHSSATTAVRSDTRKRETKWAGRPVPFPALGAETCPAARRRSSAPGQARQPLEKRGAKEGGRPLSSEDLTPLRGNDPAIRVPQRGTRGWRDREPTTSASVHPPVALPQGT